MSGEVRAVVGDQVYVNWTSYQVASDLLIPADAWSLEVADPTPDQLRAIGEGDAMSLEVDDITVLKGWVDEVSVQTSREGTRLTVSGRDFAAPLVDCHVPTSWQRTGTTLAELARRALAELGISANVLAASEADERIATVRSEPGESFWDLLSRQARARRLLVWTSPAGLHLGRPDYDQATVGTLRRHVPPDPRSLNNNILEATATWRTAGRRSHITVLGQAAGSDDLFGGTAARVKGTATDSDLVALGLYRPGIVVDGAVDSSRAAKRRAEYEVGRRAGEAFTARLVVPGHLDVNGAPWAPDTMVGLVDDRIGLAGVYWVQARRFMRARGTGTRTELVLREKNAILPEVV